MGFSFEYAVLSHDDEVAAFSRGDREALVCSVLPWVMKQTDSICRRYRFNDFESAMSSAMAAVNKSIDTFSPEHGKRFITYSGRAAKWAVLQEMERSRKERYITATDAMTSEKMAQSVNSQTGGEYIESKQLMSLFPDKQDRIDVEYREVRDLIMGYLPTLTEKQQQLLKLFLSGVSLTDAAKQLGFSKQRSHQLFASAISCIRRNIEQDGIDISELA